MLRSIKQTYGKKLAALDGDIGHVEDYYFEDQKWAVRYLVVDTGTWLPGRQVLLTPHVFDNFQTEDQHLAVKLTRQQIADSPPVDAHKPLSRQYELEYYRHYGWPNYWEGGGLWGLNNFPTLQRPAGAPPNQSGEDHDTALVSADAHLRSTQAVGGYQIQATDGIIGHVCDYLMDSTDWAIQQLVVKIGHRLSGRDVLIPVGLVERISYDDSTVFIRLTRDEVEKCPVHTSAQDHPENQPTTPPIPHRLAL